MATQRRMISKTISTSTKLALVSDFEALLFTWMIPHCDDGGNLDANPLVVRGLVVPMRIQTAEEVDQALQNLEKVGLISFYEANGTPYLHINQFDKFQTLRGDRPDYRYPPYPQKDEEKNTGKPSGNHGETVGKRNLTKQNITEHNITERKSTRAKKKKPEQSIDYLKKLPTKDVKEFTERFQVSADKIRSKAEDLLLYCQRKGRTYKNYRAFLLNALKRDFGDNQESAGTKYKVTKL